MTIKTNYSVEITQKGANIICPECSFFLPIDCIDKILIAGDSVIINYTTKQALGDYLGDFKFAEPKEEHHTLEIKI